MCGLLFSDFVDWLVLFSGLLDGLFPSISAIDLTASADKFFFKVYKTKKEIKCERPLMTCSVSHQLPAFKLRLQYSKPYKMDALQTQRLRQELYLLHTST